MNTDRPAPSKVAPPPEELLQRYQQLKQYVSLSESDIHEAIQCWPLVQPTVPSIVDDFYGEILRHSETRKVLENEEQVNRLKRSLSTWISELFSGVYDERFVVRRWQVGFRHVEIGLSHIWVTAAMTRLRERLLQLLRENWDRPSEEYESTASTLRRMIDLDLALIEDAYHVESVAQHIFQERDFAEGVIETAQAIVMVITLDGDVVRSNTFLDTLVYGRAGKRTLADQLHSHHSDTHLNFFGLVPGEQHELVQRHLEDALNGADSRPFETYFRLRSGERRSIRWLARAFWTNSIARENIRSESMEFTQKEITIPRMSPGENHHQKLVLCVGQDITDLREAQKSLVQKERLAAIGQTMTGLAHESRNAFQRSQAALETLLLELEDRPAAVQLIERIQRAHDHLLHLYEEVLQFARPIRFELRTIRLEQYLNQTWNHIVQTSADGHVRLDINNKSTSDEVSADPYAIEQVLRNLLENAVQASEANSKIWITIADTSVGEHPAIEIAIRDFGKGLPVGYAERVFEPFFTTRPRGTGLGLPIARRLIESHGGSLQLENAEPGCRARLCLPRCAILDNVIEVDTEDTRRIRPN